MEMEKSGGGHSHMLVDIDCLSLDPLFYADLAPNDPVLFFFPHPVTPLFSTFVKNLMYKLEIFSCFACILKNL